MPANYFLKQDTERKVLLAAIHEIILDKDRSVQAHVGKMMGKEMVLYHAPGIFKYGLASNKGHMSLHVMPIYCAPSLHQKYQKLLPQAKFQKGCINFSSAAEMPLNIVNDLIADCSRIDLAAIRAQQLKKK